MKYIFELLLFTTWKQQRETHVSETDSFQNESPEV